MQVLDAAERLISARGYAATSMAEIIEESGVSSSSIYHHFDSKAGVFVAVLERGADEFLDAVRDAGVPPESDDVKARLRDLIAGSARAMVDHPRFLRLYYTTINGVDGDEVARAAMFRLRAEGFRTLSDSLEEVFSSWGPVRAKAASARVVPVLLPLFDGMFLAHGAGEVPDLDAFADDAAEAMFGLAQAPARTPSKKPARSRAAVTSSTRKKRGGA